MSRPRLTMLLAVATLLASGGCSSRGKPGTDPLSLGRRYVEDAAYRRRLLEASLVNPGNGYSQLRLTKYREEIWGALPEWNPPVETVRSGDTNGPAAVFNRLDCASVPWEHDPLIALGRDAFFRYPVQIQDAVRVGLKHPEAYGLWQSSESLGGVVREQVTAGPARIALTCASCHAMAGADGQIIPGRPNAAFNLGAMLTDGLGQPPSDGSAPWGPGRIDLTSDGIDNPIAISDLRSVRSERYLHHDATVRNGLIELAIRLETLIITSNNQSIRPPRKVTFAMALYLWELNPKAIAQPDAVTRRGEKVFSMHCARCHAPPDYSGDRVALAAIGTDPGVGSSPERTTGTYRVPSLRGVGDRAPLFAAGQVRSLEVLMNPTRKELGHRYGLDLPAEGRSDLIAFLKTIE